MMKIISNLLNWEESLGVFLVYMFIWLLWDVSFPWEDREYSILFKEPGVLRLLLSGSCTGLEWASSLNVLAKFSICVQIFIFLGEIIHGFHRDFQGVHNAEKFYIHFSRIWRRSMNRRSRAQRPPGSRELRKGKPSLT